MMRESMCDSCMSPGACCKRIFLTGGALQSANNQFERAVDQAHQPMSRERAEHMIMGKGLWMFQPSDQSEDGTWTFACSALNPDGRCSIYEERPQLCRSYRPGQDPLCVHYFSNESEMSA